jgi:hypothetical protein
MTPAGSSSAFVARRAAVNSLRSSAFALNAASGEEGRERRGGAELELLDSGASWMRTFSIPNRSGKVAPSRSSSTLPSTSLQAQTRDLRFPTDYAAAIERSLAPWSLVPSLPGKLRLSI